MPKMPSTSGGGTTKISDADPKSEIDWIIYRAKQTPGPNAYLPKMIPGASFTPKMAKVILNRSLTGSFIGANKHLDPQIMMYL